MRPATRQVISGIEGILGYTELHPTVTAQVNELDRRFKDLEDIVSN